MTHRARISSALAFCYLCALLALLSGCAKAPPNLSPKGAAAFQATKAVQVLDVIRDFATSANAQTPPVLSTATTRKVVTFHKSIVQTIRAVPDGWKPVALQALDALKADIPPPEWKRLAPYVALLTIIIQEAP